MVRISSTAGPDSARFFDLWEAMVALNAMCVRVGKKGTSVQIGRSFHSLTHLSLMRVMQRPLIPLPFRPSTKTQYGDLQRTLRSTGGWSY